MRLLKPHWVTHGSASKKDAFRKFHLALMDLLILSCYVTPLPHCCLARPIYTLDIHPDGKRLATGGLTDGGGLVILWDMAIIRQPKLESPSTPKKLFQMDNHQGKIP